MDERTLTALKGSIKKWEDIVAGTGADEGADNCPLCQLFNGDTDETDLGCKGCPVADRAGECCDGTPYEKWVEYGIWDKGRRADTPQLLRLAQAELDFLKSLLPDGE